VRSITTRASPMGEAERVTSATAPARPSRPSIRQASHSTVPSRVRLLPTPALNASGSASMLATAATTASTASPPRARTLQPAASAAASPRS
jgi:hypothetical protein